MFLIRLWSGFVCVCLRAHEFMYANAIIQLNEQLFTSKNYHIEKNVPWNVIADSRDIK